MSLPMKIKISVSVIVDAVLPLFFMTLLFKEVSATCRKMHGITDKRMNVHSSVDVAVEGLALSQSLQDGQPNNHVPKPPPPPQSSIVGYSFEEGLARKSCGPHHDKNVPCPPSLRTEMEKMKVNGKAEITMNHQTSIDAGKNKSADTTGLMI